MGEWGNERGLGLLPCVVPGLPLQLCCVSIKAPTQDLPAAWKNSFRSYHVPGGGRCGRENKAERERETAAKEARGQQQ